MVSTRLSGRSCEEVKSRRPRHRGYNGSGLKTLKTASRPGPCSRQKWTSEELEFARRCVGQYRLVMAENKKRRLLSSTATEQVEDEIVQEVLNESIFEESNHDEGEDGEAAVPLPEDDEVITMEGEAAYVVNRYMTNRYLIQ